MRGPHPGMAGRGAAALGHTGGLLLGALSGYLIVDHACALGLARVHLEDQAHVPHYPWSHAGMFSSYDHAR